MSPEGLEAKVNEIDARLSKVEKKVFGDKKAKGKEADEESAPEKGQWCNELGDD